MNTSIRSFVTVIVLSYVVFLMGCTTETPSPLSSQKAASQKAASEKASAAVDASQDERLNAFFEQIFERDIANSPNRQTFLGLKTDRQGEWTDISDDYASQQLAIRKADLAVLTSDFDYPTLSEESQLSYDIFKFNLEQSIENAQFRRHFYVVDQFRGQFTGPLSLLQNNHKIDTQQDAIDYISRIQGLEGLMNEMVKQSKDREAFGVIVPKFAFQAMIADITSIIEQSPLKDDFSQKVSQLDISDDEKNALINQANEAIEGAFKRGYRALLNEVTRLSKVQDKTQGVWALPDGEKFYQNRIRHHTNLELSAEHIHDFGQADVERIHQEMREIMQKVEFEGSLQDFFAFVRNDPNNFYPNNDAGREAFLDDARNETAEIFKVAPQFFKRLPKAELDVRRVEPWRENSTSIAFYNRPSMDGSRPGIYYANLADMTGVQKYVFKAITFHEGVPGHHFQLAMAQELKGVPNFRRFGGGSAYVEGWALYAEKLAKEMGFYTDPLHDFGRLQNELWRSVRLVTDTGIHAKKWTREQTIEYFVKNTPLSEQDIVTEVERYFVNPGQALGYKMGMEKILELRGKAQSELESKFDIREFHDAVLSKGPMPLPILAEQIGRYIAASK
ncbi:DUF885 family protein [Aliiglaciecola sp. M165]|uniref:DUF885 domain-containing protein n=1 Tax=Aliiglaciecola sp. M165 TaxID=2593649 RepID=UPI00118040F5|nr:DUF885 domain-containing protein [Aliiglaciecola sp. M165]TRY32048.1 DUF885 domain-containing protein [Aliiglaciecola sp. M165]